MKTIKKLFKGLLFTFGLFVSMGIVMEMSDPPSPASQANVEVIRSLKTYVKGKVKFPESISFGEYNVKAVGSNVVNVSLDFSSNNSFGNKVNNTVYASVVITDNFEIAEIKNTKIK